jgi:quercetin dioxygenase-like cupin family protein
MQVFDLKSIEAHSQEGRERNVLFLSEEFSARIVALPPGGVIHPCEMASNVVFTVVSGSATLLVDGEEVVLEEGYCLISEPATLSMRTEHGVRLLGIQIPQQ